MNWRGTANTRSFPLTLVGNRDVLMFVECSFCKKKILSDVAGEGLLRPSWTCSRHQCRASVDRCKDTELPIVLRLYSLTTSWNYGKQQPFISAEEKLLCCLHGVVRSPVACYDFIPQTFMKAQSSRVVTCANIRGMATEVIVVWSGK